MYVSCADTLQRHHMHSYIYLPILLHMVTFPCLYHYNAKYVLFKKTKQNYAICSVVLVGLILKLKVLLVHNFYFS